MEFNNLGQPVIQLTQDDYENCLEIVALTLKVAEELNFKNSKYDMNPEQAYAVNLCGALGEQAVANYFDYPYSYLGYDPKNNDVLGYEVRATYYATGRLLTHPMEERANDIGGDKNGRYILVTIEQLTLTATIRGYSTLTRCNERKSNWDTALRWPCFAMPQDQLWPIDMLPASEQLLAFRQAKAAA